MDRTTPAAVFATAAAASAAGDWLTLFRCLDHQDINRLARMSMPSLGDSGDVLDLCGRHGVSDSALADLDAAARAVVDSASTVTAITDTQQMLIASNRHRQLLKHYEAAADRCVAELADPPSFVADAERMRRAVSGGGLVSSTLFVDDQLSPVTVNGARATATRRIGQHTEPIRFNKRRDGWRIRLFS